MSSDDTNPHISHIIVFMLENRSFDNVLGWLYGGGADVPQHYHPPRDPKQPVFRGLNFDNAAKLVNQATLGNELITQSPIRATRATNIPGYDPGEEFEHVNNQLFGQTDRPSRGTKPKMTGFLADYAKVIKPYIGEPDADTCRQIMANYAPADLPIINTLAKKFAVCDEWFCSVPSQTNTNRAFSLTGTSLGLVDNGYLTEHTIDAWLANDRFETNTLFNTLHDNGFDDWGIFWFDPYPPRIWNLKGYPYTRNLFPHLEKIPNVDSYFHKFEDKADGFVARTRNGTLPKFTYIEPSWGGKAGLDNFMGNEMHPPSDTTPAEHLLLQIYNEITSPRTSGLDKPLLVILCDEHGGTFDHVPPPWNATPPEVSQAKPNQYGFGFDRLGVRVPAILVSHGIRENTVFRAGDGEHPFDHTSLPATVLRQFLPQLDREDWNLGERTKVAPTFHHVVAGPDVRPPGFHAFAPTREAVDGMPVCFGDPIFLRSPEGKFVSFAVSDAHYYPVMGDTAATLSFHGEAREVRDDPHYIVQLRTQEFLEPERTSGENADFPGIRNTLGAFLTEHNLYYWTAIDSMPKQLTHQSWRVIEATPSSTKVIKYGDEVYLENVHFKGQDMVAQGRYLTTTEKRGPHTRWTIVPGIRHQAAALDRLREGDHFDAPLNTFVNLAVASGEVGHAALITFLQDAPQALANAPWNGDAYFSVPVGSGWVHFSQLVGTAALAAAIHAFTNVTRQILTGAQPLPNTQHVSIRMQGKDGSYIVDGVTDVPGAPLISFDLRPTT